MTIFSYYPMFPADPSVPLEVTKRANLRMPVVPDVMLLPSQLQPFVKVNTLGFLNNI